MSTLAGQDRRFQRLTGWPGLTKLTSGRISAGCRAAGIAALATRSEQLPTKMVRVKHEPSPHVEYASLDLHSDAGSMLTSDPEPGTCRTCGSHYGRNVYTDNSKSDDRS